MAEGSGVVNERVKAALRDAIAKKTGAFAEEAPLVAEPAAAPPPPPPIEAPTCGPNQVLLSTLIDGVKPEQDMAVTVRDPSTTSEAVRHLIPDLDPLYKADVEAMRMLLMSWEHNDTTLIHGPPGCGKSQLVKQGCALTHRAYIRINMTEDAESSVIFGSLVARDGSTHWVDGPATEAVRYGAVLNVDEWDVTPPGVFMGFQWLLENDGKLFLKEMPGEARDKIIVPHSDTRFVMCGNTVGQGDETGAFAGTAPQNSAGIDRFETTIRMRYLEQRDEIDMLKHVFKKEDISKMVPAALITKMVTFANLCRAATEQRTLTLGVSPRTLINIGRKIAQYNGDVRMALAVAYLNKLTNSQRDVVAEFANKAFGSV